MGRYKARYYLQVALLLMLPAMLCAVDPLNIRVENVEREQFILVDANDFPVGQGIDLFAQRIFVEFGNDRITTLFFNPTDGTVIGAELAFFEDPACSGTPLVTPLVGPSGNQNFFLVEAHYAPGDAVALVAPDLGTKFIGPGTIWFRNPNDGTCEETTLGGNPRWVGPADEFPFDVAVPARPMSRRTYLASLP